MDTRAIRSRGIVTVTEWELCDELDATRARLAEAEARIVELQAETQAANRRRWQQKMQEPRGDDPTAPPESEVTG